MDTEEFIKATGLQFPVTIGKENMVKILNHFKKLINQRTSELIEEWEDSDIYESGSVSISELFENHLIS